jgi:two-component system, LytTR family, sensor kinase
MADPGPLTAADAHRDPVVSDLWPRLLLSPVLGAAIPNVSGLIDHSRHSPAGIALSYVYFAFVAFAIWEGNRRIYFRLQRREEWLRRPRRRLALLLGAIALYTIPVATLLMWIWRDATGDHGTHAFAIPMALLTTVAAVTVITHVYETVFLLRDWESDRLRRARTEHARLEAELEALGRQVDPHFLFNHLNALAHLIEQRSDAAVPFIAALSHSYRYVLDARGQRLVPLSLELDALRRHELLARIQYRGRVMLAVDVDGASALRFQIPPVTLGELFQNAIKHNLTSDDEPLRITVSLSGDTLVFANDLRPRHDRGASTGIGLSNLSQRFSIATGREPDWGPEGDRFVVRLPLPAAPQPRSIA